MDIGRPQGLAGRLAALAASALIGLACGLSGAGAQETALSANAAAGLRGSQAAAAPAAPRLTPIPAGALAFAPDFAAPGAASVTRPAADQGVCRAACARTYYFCGAEEAEPSCGERWGRCVFACGRGSSGLPLAGE